MAPENNSILWIEKNWILGSKFFVFSDWKLIKI